MAYGFVYPVGATNHSDVSILSSLQPTNVTTRLEFQPPAALMASSMMAFSLLISSPSDWSVQGGSLIVSNATKLGLHANVVPI